MLVSGNFNDYIKITSATTTLLVILFIPDYYIIVNIIQNGIINCGNFSINPKHL